MDVYTIGMSRNKNSKKSALVVLLLEKLYEMGPTFIEELVPTLHEFSSLRVGDVSLKVP